LRRLNAELQADITERKQLEAQLLQAQKMESIGRLAADIAHDFNNLLTPISGFAELLLGKAPEGSQQQEYLRQIKMAAERAATLTGQLRLFTRQDQGERRPVQLNSVVEETRALLERSISKEIAIELRLASELWAVEADLSQLSQVLVNLSLGQRLLELCGYIVLMAEDGLQALEVYQAYRGEIALVVLDVVMPQMGGLECLHRLRELDPQVKVLIGTGYTATGLAQKLVAEGALGVVEKRFQIQDFATAVRTTIDG
jgi:CheY-like chemotaxis protein